MERRVRVFYYGSFINLDVLKKSDVTPERVDTARLFGWEIRIAPLATIIPAPDAIVYGIVADCSHAELDRLYSQDWVGGYLPEAVSIETLDGARFPALTYIKWGSEQKPASRDYIERIAAPAERLGFPEWYLKHIRSFVP